MAVDAAAGHAHASAMTLTVATWNIHGAVGGDGRYAPGRVVDVLGELNADLVALQEVASAQAHECFLTDLGSATGYHVASGPLLQQHGSDFGNAVLSRYAFKTIAHLDLAVDDYEPRGALDVCIEIGTRPALRVLATHLGLRPGERREQVRRLLAAVEREIPHPTLLMGDLNEWYLWGRPLRWLHTHFREVPAAPPTFPARRPVLALDRIWVSPAGRLRRLACHASPLARIASDHLPLTAEVVL
jgi:phospholipase D1/2